MKLEDLQATCPNCGSALLRKTDSGFECVNCETRFMNPYDTRHTNVRIVRDEAKIERIRSDERANKRDDRFVIGAFIVLALIVALCVYYLDSVKEVTPPVARSSEYQGQSIEFVRQVLKDSGFANVKTESLHDVSSSDPKYQTVDTVYIEGETEWETGLIFKNRKKYKKSSPITIYYHGP